MKMIITFLIFLSSCAYADFSTYTSISLWTENGESIPNKTIQINGEKNAIYYGNHLVEYFDKCKPHWSCYLGKQLKLAFKPEFFVKQVDSWEYEDYLFILNSSTKINDDTIFVIDVWHKPKNFHKNTIFYSRSKGITGFLSREEKVIQYYSAVSERGIFSTYE